jgi:hypothetical protein
MKHKSDAHHTLSRFLHEVGIPSELLTDGAKELTIADWGKLCSKHNIYQITTEPHSPWQNHAEGSGRNIKNKVKRTMRKTNTPVRLWDYCWEYEAGIQIRTASANPKYDSLTPYDKIHHYTPNITEYLYFKWYDWVWYVNEQDPSTKILGRWLGPAQSVGQGNAYHILSFQAKVKTRSSVMALSASDLADVNVQRRMEDFTTNVELKIGNYANATVNSTEIDPDELKSADIYDLIFEGDKTDNDDFDPVEKNSDGTQYFRPEVDSIESEPPGVNDENIGRRVQLANESGEMMEATIKNRIKHILVI